AAKDEALVEEIVDLLDGGIGLNPDDIFCSSLPGMGARSVALFSAVGLLNQASRKSVANAPLPGILPASRRGPSQRGVSVLRRSARFYGHDAGARQEFRRGRRPRP